MGGPTKFRFPLPHRRPKHQTQEVQSISAPLTNKAQKLLGTGEINIGTSPALNSDASPPRDWSGQSSIISVTISETTAATEKNIARSRSPLTTVGENKAWDNGDNGNNAKAWDQESEIIPQGLGLHPGSIARGGNQDTITDASSLRRRRSGSTIASYYDKTKLPLSISQQTSSSAMAKGLPNKAMQLLDMEAEAAPPPKPEKRRKSSRLDLTHLLPSAAASSRNPFSRLSRKGSMILGPDLMTRSPSLMSSSNLPDIQSLPAENKYEKPLRKKLTKENLKKPKAEEQKRSSTQSNMSSESVASNMRKRATETGTLYRLYEHYEYSSSVNAQDPGKRTSSRMSGAYGEQNSGTPLRQSLQSAQHSDVPPLSSSRHYAKPALSTVTRQPYSSSYSPDLKSGTFAEKSPAAVSPPVGLMLPPTDRADSVSSRHTRTSKASKRTDQSFTEFDPNMNSILSLSSDSEEDDFIELPKKAQSIPGVTSRNSVASPVQVPRSVTPDPPMVPVKSKFRTSMSPNSYFLAIPEETKTPAPPKVNPRTSSLSGSSTSPYSRPGVAPSMSTTGSSSVRSPSRLSMVSTSTSGSLASQLSRPPPIVSSQGPPPKIRHIAMLSNHAPPSGFGHGARPTIPQSRNSREYLAHVLSTQPTPPLSPSSMEFFIRSQHNSLTEPNGPSLTLNASGSAENERFMAVTKQEETLLAAMRAKRALMRESMTSEESAQTAGDRTASKKESYSSIKTVRNSLHPQPLDIRSRSSDNVTALAKPGPSSKRPDSFQSDRTSGGVDPEKHERVLMFLDRAMSTMNDFDLAEPIPDLSDFMGFDSDVFPVPPTFNTMMKAPKSAGSRTPSGTPLNPLKNVQQNMDTSRPLSDSDSVPKSRSSSRNPSSRSPAPSARCRDPSSERRPLREQRSASSSIYSQQSSHKPLPAAHTVKASSSMVNPPRISAVGLPEFAGGLWDDDG